MMGIARWLDDRVGVRALAPLRIALGPILLLHLQPFLSAAADGRSYADTFHQPFLSWLPQPPRQLYVFLLLLAASAAPLISLGYRTRLAAWYATGFVAWNLSLSETHFHHNRFFLLILLAGAAALPSGAHLSLDARRGRGARPDGAGWVMVALRFELASVYALSGISKVIDGDWWGGIVLRIRVERYADELADDGVPDWLLEVLTSSGFHWWFAKVVVLTELFIGFGLLFRRTRMAAIWVAIPFHVLIEVTAEVQVFSWAALAALVVWSDPRSGDRRITVASRRAALVVRGLDWLGRFDVVVADGPTSMIDRDGSMTIGRDAVERIASLLPLTFWFTAPLRLLRGRARTVS